MYVFLRHATPGQGVSEPARTGVAKNILHYLMLSYLRTIAKSLRRRNETHLAVVLTCHQDHTF